MSSKKTVITGALSDRWQRHSFERSENSKRLAEFNGAYRGALVRLRSEQRAGAVVGSLNIADGSVDIAVEGIDFSPLHWVALADSCLEHAAKRMAAQTAPALDLIKLIEAARASLDFGALKPQ